MKHSGCNNTTWLVTFFYNSQIVLLMGYQICRGYVREVQFSKMVGLFCLSQFLYMHGDKIKGIPYYLISLSSIVIYHMISKSTNVSPLKPLQACYFSYLSREANKNQQEHVQKLDVMRFIYKDNVGKDQDSVFIYNSIKVLFDNEEKNKRRKISKQLIW